MSKSESKSNVHKSIQVTHTLNKQLNVIIPSFQTNMTKHKKFKQII